MYKGKVILCDDASSDNTSVLAKQIGINHIIIHEKNKGYGGNQKSLYNKALELGGDIVIMLHPDYQYTPKSIPAMVNIIGDELFPVVLGSRSQIIYGGFHIAEVTCPTKYFEEASSINLSRSTTYGLGVLRVSFNHFLQRTGLFKFNMYKKPK